MWPKVYVPRPAGIGWPVFHLHTRSPSLGKAPKVYDAVHNVQFVKYDVTVSFMAQVLDTVAMLTEKICPRKSNQ